MGDQTQITEPEFRIVPNSSTAEVLIRGADGFIQSTQSWICTGTTSSPAWQIVQRDVNYYTAGFFLERTSRDTGSGNAWDVVTNSWSKGRIDYTMDENGVRTNFTYDSANRVSTRTRVVPGLQNLTTTYAYDAANNVINETTANLAGEYLETRRTFNTGGHLTSETTPGYATGSSAVSAITTTYSPSSWNRINTITLPSGGTKIETLYPDGRRLSITGTGVVPEYYTYTSQSDGTLRTRVDVGTATSARYYESWHDMLGRLIKTRRPGFTGQVPSEETSTYDSAGRLASASKTGLSSTLYVYNSMSQLIRSGLDVDGSGTLVPASNDRITDTSSGFEFLESAWWAVKTNNNYPYTGGSGATPKQMGKIRERLTGRSGTLRAETRTYDAEDNETRVTTTFDSVNAQLIATTKRPGMVSDQVKKAVAGLVLETTGHDGLVFKKRYDALARLEKEIDPRTGTEAVPTTKYFYQFNTTWPSDIRDATNRRLTLTRYDSAGRVAYTEDAAGKTTRTAYTLRNETEKVWGSATYPVTYVYNEYGERTKMRTYRDPTNASAADTTTFPSLGSFDETTWEFDTPSGLLKKKIDATNKFVEYTYNLRGQTHERFWFRTLPNSSTRVAATFSYDASTGENTGITYNDSTAAVSYSYARTGQIDSVTDAAGTRDFIHDATKPWQLAAEALDTFYGGRVLTHTYESTLSTNTGDSTFTGHTIGSVPGRAKGLQVGTLASTDSDLEFVYASSNVGRIAGVVSKRANGAASRQFRYGYESNSSLVNTLTVGWLQLYRGFEPNRDLVTNVQTFWNGTTRTKFVYEYDDRRQRSSVVQSGDVFADYGAPNNGAIHQIFTYNGRGELVGAGTFMGATATDQSMPLSARRHEFDYDGIGNRRWANTSGNAAIRDDYTANALNQYTARENNTLAVGGTVANDSAIQVAVGNMTTTLAGRSGRHWGDNVVLDNSAGPFWGPLSVSAVKPGNSSTAYSIETTVRTASIPAATQVFTYDADGNLTGDGMWTYEWDAENRLWAMQTNAAAILRGMPGQRLEFKYDYMSRRVEKTILTGATFTNVDSRRRFLYDGWSMIAEFSVSGSTLTLARSYTWGLDIARSLKDAGGVGALVQIRDHFLGKDYFPSYDGNGNIAALFDADNGNLAAAYEYSPYGEFLRCEGAYAKENPFRFSTKFTDNETGLVYYGRRYYSPSQGRFLGRDPKEEAGGLNLYGFCRNNSINLWDVLGMEPYGNPMNGSDVHSEVVVINGIVYNRTWNTIGSNNEGDEYRWDDPNDEAIGTYSPDGNMDFGAGSHGDGGYGGGSDFIMPDIGVGIVIAATTPVQGQPRPVTTTIQIFARPVIVKGVNVGLHAFVVVTSGSQPVVLSAMPSRKLSDAEEVQNLTSDVGVTLIAQDPQTKTFTQSTEWRTYTRARIRDPRSVYQSSVLSFNGSFDAAMASVNTFNAAVNNADIPYMSTTTNSNAYAFSLVNHLTGIQVIPQPNVNIRGYNIPLFPGVSLTPRP